MVKEWQGKQLVLNQPAGHVENRESLENAVIREVLEETSWQVKPTQLLGIYSFTPSETADTYHRVCFVCTPLSKEHNNLDPDIDSCEWMTKEDILSQPLRSQLVSQCIEDFEKGLTFPLNLMNNSHLMAYDNCAHEVQ